MCQEFQGAVACNRLPPCFPMSCRPPGSDSRSADADGYCRTHNASASPWPHSAASLALGHAHSTSHCCTCWAEEVRAHSRLLRSELDQADSVRLMIYRRIGSKQQASHRA